MKNYLCLVLVFIILVVGTGNVSAFDFDNVKSDLIFGEGISEYGKIEIRDWFGLTKLVDLELKTNTNFCSINCNATKEITLYQEGVLIEDVKFETIKDNKRMEEKIIDYQFYILQNGKRVEYDLGDKIQPGTYQVLLEGKKNPLKTVDWMIKSNGRWIEEWFIWSPSDLIISSNTDMCFGNHYYKNIIINNSAVVTVCAENGTSGSGTLGLYAAKNFTLASGCSISSLFKGYAGGDGGNEGGGVDGEGTGGGDRGSAAWGDGGGGEGAGHYGDGGDGGDAGAEGYGGDGDGIPYGNISDETYLIGSGGGGGADGGGSYTGGDGGDGGGAIKISAEFINVHGNIYTNGHYGYSSNSNADAGGGGGGGSGGTILLYGLTIDTSNAGLESSGGSGGNGHDDGADYAGGGGGGSGGMIKVFYNNSYTSTGITVDVTGGTKGNGDGGSNGNDGPAGNYSVSHRLISFEPYLELVLNSPTDNYISTTNLNTYNCTATAGGGATILNATLYTNETSWSAKNITTGLTLGVETITWDRVSSNSIYAWNCYVCNNLGNCTFADTNRTLKVNAELSVDIIYPDNIIYGTNVSELNYTYVTAYPHYCWYSMNGGVSNSTLQSCGTNWSSGLVGVEGANTWVVFINNSVGEESQDTASFTIDTTAPALNITYPLTYVNYQRFNQNLRITYTHSDDNPSMCWYNYGGINTTITCGTGYFDINISDRINTSLILYANDTTPLLVSDNTSWTYKLMENVKNYNQTAYETLSENYIVNLSSTNLETVTATFNYNGIVYDAIRTGNNEEMFFTSTGPTFAEGDTGNNSFFWNLSYGGEYISSQIYYQQVADLEFQQCNGTGYPFINFTFKDEETGGYISAELLTTNLEYWLGDGTQKKYLTFSNTTANPSYDFCLNVNYTLHHDGTFRYSNTSYPQRIYTTNGDLTNTTINIVLYLLHEDDGIYTTVQVVDQDGDKLTGVEVTVERQFSGVWTVIGIDDTDSAGLVTFWVNPDYDHKFTFVKEDCTGITSTIRPTQTTYTQTMNCAADTDIYISPLQGIIFSRTPAEGLIAPGSTNFTYQIVSSRNNIANVSMEIIFANGTLINSTWNTCAPEGCTIFCTYTVYDGMSIKGRYYVDIGNGSIMLEGDAHWMLVDIDTGGSNLLQFFKDIKLAIDGWSDDSENLTDDYNRLVIAFFFICLMICLFNYYTGMDSLSPGAFMIFMTAIIFLGSISDGAFGQGYFYYNNLSTIDFVNNYILLILMLILTVGQFITVGRQAQR